MEKQCTKCGHSKDSKEFYRLSKKGYHFSRECRQCRSDRHKDKLLKSYPACGLCGWPNKNPGNPLCKKCLIASGFKKCRTCLDYRLAALDFYDKKAVCKDCMGFGTKNTESLTSKEKARDSYYKLKYGISLEEYEMLLEQQNGGCAICGEAEMGKPLVVDHEHYTGKVRGLLCFGCNIGLGCFKDSLSSLNGAISYLQQASGIQPYQQVQRTQGLDLQNQ